MHKLTSIIVTLCLAVSSCNNSKNKATAEANATASISHVSEFAMIFPISDHYISYYTGTVNEPLWNSKALVYGRYVLEMQFKIDFDSSRTQPKQISEPNYYLREISSIEKMTDGRFEVTYSNFNFRFGVSEWDQLRDSGGDFSTLGIKLVVDQPVKYSKEVWPRS